MTKLSTPTTGFQQREPIPGYVLTERLGAGGYGEVWKADAPGGLQKAVKIVYGAVSDARAVRELKALERIRQVSHPMLLSLERIEAVEDHLIVVTELADQSLRDCFDQFVADGRTGIPREQLLSYLRDAADGLDYLFEKQSLQHLDVKPENLLLVGGRVKVADFGMIKDLHDKSVSIVGGLTPMYAAPELFEGRPNRHSDQYSLAVLYQEMLTGQPPFDGRTPAQLAIQQLQGSPVLSPLPRLDQPIIARALAKQPEQRFPSCRTLIDQLFESSKTSKSSPRSYVVSGGSGSTSTSPIPDRPNDTVSVGSATAPMGPLPMFHPNDVSVLEPEQIEQQPTTMRPTLLVGIGGTANKVLADIRQRLNERYGDASQVPCLRFLAIDTDADDLVRTADGRNVDWSVGESVAVPLRSATEYREFREPLLEWISRRWLYNIPRSLQTEGIRPLGRLAFVDRFADVKRAVGRALTSMLDEVAIRTSTETTNCQIEQQAPDVIVFGNIAGGTAGGAILDLAFTIRTEIRRRQLSENLRLVLLHSTNRRSSRRDLAVANTIVFLNEYASITGPNGRYPGEPTCGIPAYESAGSCFSQTNLIHLGDELDDHDFAAQVHRLGDYFSRELWGSCCGTLRALREVRRPDNQPVDFVPLNTIGISSITSLLGRLPAHLTSQVVSKLLESWVSSQALDSDKRQLELTDIDQILASSSRAEADDATDAAARELLRSMRLDRDHVLQAIQETVPSALGDTSHEYWPKFFARVLDDQAGQRIDVDSAIRRLVGRSDSIDAKSTFSPLSLQLAERGKSIATKRAAALVDCLTKTLDSPGERIHLALVLADSFCRCMRELADEYTAEMAHGDQRIPELLQIACSPGTDGPAHEKHAIPADVRRQAWQQLALLHQGWSELFGARQLARTLAAHISAVVDQMVDLARRIGRLGPAVVDITDDELSPQQLALLDWAHQEVPAWVRSLDSTTNDKLNSLGFSLSTMVDQSHLGWNQLADLVRDAAYQTVVSALVTRSLELESLEDSELQAVHPLDRLLNDAEPKMALSGGHQRWTIIVSPDATRVQAEIQKQIRKKTGHAGQEVHDASGTPLICCYMSRVPLQNCISKLVDARRELVQVAERLHSRIDVNWTPIA